MAKLGPVGDGMSKRLKRLLREAAMMAHEEELRRALGPLANDFDKWRKGLLCSGELAERVAGFQDGPARKFFDLYNYGQLDLAVAHAIVSGILERKDLSPELVEALARPIAFYEEQE
jgi:hypothetical protein